MFLADVSLNSAHSLNIIINNVNTCPKFHICFIDNITQISDYMIAAVLTGVLFTVYSSMCLI